ncbi:cytochrome c maturation protein CcmE [Methylopila henanensis]|uniref:Cytochrome c-type biogenesis protein CcmE n=1 Tax=Methylopila henanensis TaxID=873516 RepID=A0ABW4K434_9HYPH
MTIDASQTAFPSPRRRGASRKRRRLALFGLVGIVLAAATALVLTALDDTIVFFRTPSEIAQRGEAPGTRLRLGGLVKAGSISHDGPNVRFTVTDNARDMPVTYSGLLPDLFREGQGVVSEGVLQDDGTFKADTVLAKHDENYMPKDVADRMKAQGLWKGDEAGGAK